MAENNSTVQKVISEKVPEQFAGLHRDLTKSKELLVDCIVSAEKFDAVLSKSTSFKVLADNQAKANAELHKSNILREKAALLSIKLQQEEIKLEENKKQIDENETKRAIARKKREDQQAADDNARIVREAKKGKVILSNSQDEIDAYNRTVNGSKKVTTTLNETDRVYAQTSNSATSYTKSAKEAANASQTVATATLKVSPAAVAAQKSINSLKIQLASYQTIAANATDPKLISLFNAKAQETEVTINRLNNIGKKGFDEFGNAIEMSKGKLSGVWSGLKTVANILPGVGIAGLLAFAVDPILDYIKKLDLFSSKISEATITRKMLSDVQLKGAQDAQKEITELNTLYAISRNTTLSLKQRTDATNELQKQYPEYFGNLSNEIIMNGKAEEAYKRLTNALVATARARAAQDKITENSSRQLDNEQKITDLQVESVKSGTEAAKLRLQSETEIGGKRDFLLNKAIGLEARQLQIYREQNNLKTDSYLLEQRNLKLTDAITEQVKKGANLTTKPEKEAKVKAAKVDTSEQQGQSERIKALRDSSKAIVDNDKETFELRIKALELFTNSSKELADISYEADVKKYKRNNDKILALQEKLRTEYNKVDIESGKQRLKINDDAEKEIINSLTKDEQDQVNVIKQANADKLAEIESYKSEAIQGLTDQFAQGLITEDQYNQQLYDIEAQAAQDRVQLKIDELQKVIDLEKTFLVFKIGTDKQLADDEAALAAKQIELSALKTKAQIDDAKKLATAKKELHNLEKQLLSELESLGNAIVKGIFTSQLNSVQEQIDLNDRKKAQEIDLVNNSVASEEEKANKITVINAKAAAQEDLLAQKQKDIKIRQAKFEKAIDIGKAISSVALAEVQALTYLSNPLTAALYPAIAATIGAIGAVQIATILATKIEAFEHGGTKKGDGLALFGEVGTELMIDPSGKLGFTPSTPTVGMVKSGTEFISNRDLVRMLSMPDQSINVNGSSVDLSPLIKSQDNNTKILKQAIKGIKTGGGGPSKYGWYNTQNSIHQLNQYKSNNL